MGRYLQTNLDTYFKEPEPPKMKIPRSPQEFQEMTYLERLRLRQKDEKLYNYYTRRPGRKQSWER